MAKPTRYSRIDRTRKALGIQFRTRIPSLLHQRNYLSILHIQKSILAAQALRRCVELEQTLEGILSVSQEVLGKPMADAPRTDYLYSYRYLRGMAEDLQRNLELERRISASLREELALQTGRGEAGDLL